MRMSPYRRCELQHRGCATAIPCVRISGQSFKTQSTLYTRGGGSNMRKTTLKETQLLISHLFQERVLGNSNEQREQLLLASG
jgi:hypothetical protein